ncbi:MAG TPA: hypothetical protein VEQ87_00995 [Burkholderiales bacterium]|nr:hypothetical protein [Burkholderiales bacterium]
MHAAAARSELHEEPDPALIRWMPVLVPFSAALVLGIVALVWAMVL